MSTGHIHLCWQQQNRDAARGVLEGAGGDWERPGAPPSKGA